MFNLFNFASYSRIAPPSEPRIQTPLGPMILEVGVQQETLSDITSEVFGDTLSSSQAFVFPFSAARAELLICPLKPSLPPGREAQTWYDGLTEISLGTPDEGGLFYQVGHELPASWSQPLCDADMSGLYVHGIDNRGIRIAPPQLMKRESCELYFKVAWCKSSEENANPWFAIDPMHRSNSPWWPGQENFHSTSLTP